MKMSMISQCQVKKMLLRRYHHEILHIGKNDWDHIITLWQTSLLIFNKEFWCDLNVLLSTLWYVIEIIRKVDYYMDNYTILLSWMDLCVLFIQPLASVMLHSQFSQKVYINEQLIWVREYRFLLLPYVACQRQVMRSPTPCIMTQPTITTNIPISELPLCETCSSLPVSGSFHVVCSHYTIIKPEWKSLKRYCSCMVGICMFVFAKFQAFCLNVGALLPVLLQTF